MDKEVISHCVGPLSRDFLSKLPHHTAPYLNLHSVVLEKETDEISTPFLKDFPLIASLPVPLIHQNKLSREVLNGVDHTTNLIREKIKWQMKKDKIISTAKKDRKRIKNRVIKAAQNQPIGSSAVVPQGIVLLAQHLDRDPDPCFSGTCNWYYCGGTLASFTRHQDQYLLGASHSKLSYSKVIEGQDIQPFSTVDVDQSYQINQIITNKRGAAVRQKNCISLLLATESESSFAFKKVHTVTDKKNPFLSVALKNKSLKKYSTLSNNGILKLWDVEYSKNYKAKLQVAPGDGVTVSDNWASLNYVDNKTLLLTDRCCLHMFDARVDLEEPQLAWCPKKIIEQCEQLSYVTSSQLRGNIVYAMTTHHALCLDIRYGFVQRWTHMMASPPYLGFAEVVDEECEVLCLGSQVLSDCMAIMNMWKGEEPLSKYKPTRLPSPAKALHIARQHGLALDPSLTNRCTQSMIGLTSLPSDKGIYIVRQSASTDTFIQLLTDSERVNEELSEAEVKAFKEWSKPGLSLHREPTTISVSDVNDLSGLFEALKKEHPRTEKPSTENPVGQAWQLSKKYLEDCVDLLANKMLEVWEVEDEDEWTPEIEQENFIEQDPEEKVLNWLDSANSRNMTQTDQNVTGESSGKPKVTSTPFPLTSIDDEVALNTSLQDISPWMSQPSQIQLKTPINSQIVNFTPVRHFLSPPSSTGSYDQTPKKQKLIEKDVELTPKTKKTALKKPLSSAKKKFIPGF